MTNETPNEMGPEGGENRPDFGRRPAALRSRVTNGKALFVNGDGRSPWARRLRDIIDLHVIDQGGADAITEAKRSLIRRAGTITTELERIEARFATDTAKDGDFAAYTTGANALRRILESIGLDRIPRDVTPTLDQYLEAGA
jgi:hypothetical protein